MPPLLWWELRLPDINIPEKFRLSLHENYKSARAERPIHYRSPSAPDNYALSDGCNLLPCEDENPADTDGSTHSILHRPPDSHVSYSTRKEKRYHSDDRLFSVQLSYIPSHAKHGWQRSKEFHNSSSTFPIHSLSPQGLTAANLQSSAIGLHRKAFPYPGISAEPNLSHPTNQHAPYWSHLWPASPCYEWYSAFLYWNDSVSGKSWTWSPEQKVQKITGKKNEW